MKLSVVIPTYNEAGHIAALLDEIEKSLRTRSEVTEFELIIVDDSTDCTTIEAVQKHAGARTDEVIRFIKRLQCSGLASAVKDGISSARYEFVIVMDSDFNHHPRYLPIFVALAPYYDLVIGSRYLVGGGMQGSAFRYFGSYFYNLFIRSVLQTGVHDNLSGFFLMRRDLYERLPREFVFRGYGEFFIRLVSRARQRCARIVEVPVMYESRATGTSKTNFIKYLAQYTLGVFDLLRRRVFKIRESESEGPF